MAPGVCDTSAVTPSFPLPPMPTGHATEALTPTAFWNAGETFAR